MEAFSGCVLAPGLAQEGQRANTYHLRFLQSLPQLCRHAYSRTAGRGSVSWHGRHTALHTPLPDFSHPPRSHSVLGSPHVRGLFLASCCVLSSLLRAFSMFSHFILPATGSGISALVCKCGQAVSSPLGCWSGSWGPCKNGKICSSALARA